MFSLKTAIALSFITLASFWIARQAITNADSSIGISLLKTEVDKTLRFNSNHEFTILQFTDLHFGEDEDKDKNTASLQEFLIATVKPDIVVITGDAVSGYSWDKKSPDFYRKNWEKFTAAFTKMGIRYAFTLGNHDTDADLNAKEVGELDKTHSYSLFNGTDTIDPKSYSNYHLEVKSSFKEFKDQTTALLWIFDSKNRGCMDVPESWGCLTENQLEWYLRTSAEYMNTDQYSFVQGLAFFHIPLVEFMELWNYGKTSGTKSDMVSCPLVNTNAFSVFRSAHNIKSIFVGHDHNNDYFGNFKGIDLAYGRKTGFGGYGPDLKHGARVIKLSEYVEPGTGNLMFNIRSHIIQEDGSIIEPEEPTYQGDDGFQITCDSS